jgi:antitoxin VapB
MELSGKEVLIHREGERLIIEPIDTTEKLLDLLSSLGPINDAFPDVDEGLLPLDDIRT